MAPFRLGFRVCDRRYPFLWSQSGQPGGRWNRPDDPPRHSLASSPLVAWAEWLRHQEIQDPEDLEGVAAALWAVLMPPSWGPEILPLVFVLWCPAESLLGWPCVKEGRPWPEWLPLVRRLEHAPALRPARSGSGDRA